MRASEKIGQKLRHELKVIETLQREWNALSEAERISVAKVSPDLSLFFRRGLTKVDRMVTGKVIDLAKIRRAGHRDANAKPKAKANCSLEQARSGDLRGDRRVLGKIRRSEL